MFHITLSFRSPVEPGAGGAVWTPGIGQGQCQAGEGPRALDQIYGFMITPELSNGATGSSSVTFACGNVLTRGGSCKYVFSI